MYYMLDSLLVERSERFAQTQSASSSVLARGLAIPNKVVVDADKCASFTLQRGQIIRSIVVAKLVGGSKDSLVPGWHCSVGIEAYMQVNWSRAMDSSW
jgi:hypothetical protein